MPIITQEQVLDVTQKDQVEATNTVDTPIQVKPSLMETTSAFFKLENPIFNATKELFLPDVSEQFDPSFRPIEKLENEHPDLMEYADRFVDVGNQEQFDRKVFNAEYEIENKKVLSDAGGLTTVAAGMAAGLIDPITLIPFVRVAKGANMAARAVKGGLLGGGLGLVAGTAQEAVLQNTEVTRSTEQSLTNIVIESVAGSIFGAGFSALKPSVQQSSKKLLADAIEGKDLHFVVDEIGSVKLDHSVGSMELNSKAQLDALGLAHIDENLVKVLTGPEFIRPPDIRAILSPSISVRKLGEVFYNSNLIRNKHAKGVAALDKAEAHIYRDAQLNSKILSDVDDMYLKYTGKGSIASAFQSTRGAEKISHGEYSTRIWNKLIDENYVDDIPQVNAASDMLRAQMDKQAKLMQDMDLLPKDLDPKFMRNYMTRIYDQEKLNVPANQEAFTQKIGAWLSNNNKDGSVRATPLDLDTAVLKAEGILDKIRGETEQAIALSSIAEGFISKGKFLKSRQLLIPDSEIKDFLVTDGLKLFRHYQDKTSKLIAAKNALTNAGFEDFQGVVRSIRSEADAAIAGITDPVMINKLAKQFKNEEDLANKMYRSVLGQLRKPGKADRYLGAALNYQFTRLLGGVTISSLGETMMVPFRHGFARTLQDGYLPLIRDLKTAKLSRDQMYDLTGALQFEQANLLRLRSGLEGADQLYHSPNTWDTVQNLATKGMVKASGIGWWTTFGSRMAGQVIAADLVRTLKKGVQSADIERLAVLGITPNNIPDILAQVNKYSQKINGSYVINPHLWKDKDALNIFKNAIQIDMDSAILKPGIGTQPFIVQQHMAAKVAFQFKSFMSSATSKILISGIQRRDANVLQGVTGLVVVGGLVQELKDMISGVENNYSALDFIENGVSNSGLLGLMGTTLLDTTRSIQSDKKYLYLDQSVLGTITGPTISQIPQAVKAAKGLASPEVSPTEAKAALKMLPFSNLFYINAIMSRVFDTEEKK